ncbi:MAG TPA: ERAP1-like C-terminal domain-containing protein, partial [Acidimicrobiales bacterium]|nr:ERAP1-like C-terminal domain-containing protein [Acidimicrobiales bacterium]
LTFARLRFDPASWQALSEVALDIGDPVTESACWNAAWDMTTSAELAAADFVDLVGRRISSATALPGLADLLGQAVQAADYYATPGQRPDLRRRLADAALAGAERAEAGGKQEQTLAVGFATSAQSDVQLDLLAAWLRGQSLPGGVVTDIDLRGRILLTLAAADRACDSDLDDLVAVDPVSGQVKAATCRAMRPDEAAKQAAWTAALSEQQSPRMAIAHAQGVWVPGQEELMEPWRRRYFSQALVDVAARDTRTQQRLGRFLYPSILAEQATVGLTEGALARGDLTDTLRQVLVSQKTILQEIMAARASSRSGGPSASA